MIALAGGDWQAVLLPGRGSALARLSHAGREVLEPLALDGDPNNEWAGAFLMLPWTNRLDGGLLPFAGGEHRFPCNRAEERTALHGFGRERGWTVREQAGDRAVLSQQAAEGPYDYEAVLSVTLGEAFSLSLSVRHRGADGVPYGTGWHPFFRRVPGTTLGLRATAMLRRDARNLPVEAVPSEGVSGGEERFDGLDTHFTGWDGEARIGLGDAAFRLRGEGAWRRNLQVFAPRGAGIFSIEPVSHVPDVANRPFLAPLGAMVALAHGETLDGGVTLMPAM